MQNTIDVCSLLCSLLGAGDGLVCVCFGLVVFLVVFVFCFFSPCLFVCFVCLFLSF